MTINLPPALEERLLDRVASGAFPSIQAAVEAAIEDFLDREEDPQDLAEALNEAIREADAGQTISLEEFDRGIRARYGISR